MIITNVASNCWSYIHAPEFQNFTFGVHKQIRVKIIKKTSTFDDWPLHNVYYALLLLPIPVTLKLVKSLY